MDSALKPGRKALKDPKIESVDSFKELSGAGFTAYSLGPVYVYAGVQDCLPEAFAAEQTSKDVRGTILHFERPVIARCEQWNTMLEVMDTESFQFFMSWMMALQLVDRQAGRFSLVRHYRAPLFDPIAADKKQVFLPITLDVFCPSSLQCDIKPKAWVSDPKKVPFYVDFEMRKPDSEVVKIGAAAMSMLKEMT